MKKYVANMATSTPQAVPIPEREHSMVRNRAGGWGFPVTDEVRLMRFLLIGTESASYYASAREMTMENVVTIERMLENGQGDKVIDAILDVSERGRAPKQEPTILALAMCLKRAPEVRIRKRARAALPRVCRTNTHLATFLTALDAVGEKGAGWGRQTRTAIQGWIHSKDPDSLGYQWVKYRNRSGWTPRDELRMAHPRPEDEHENAVYKWAAGKGFGDPPISPSVVYGYEQIQVAEEADGVASLIRDHDLPWEAVPSRWARDDTVQSALFESMPMTALVRQLGRLTHNGFFDGEHGMARVRMAVNRITNREAIRRSRIHPMALYMAARTYDSGGGMRSSLRWTPNKPISNAIARAFGDAFENVEPSGKPLLIAMDASGSMFGTPVGDTPGFACHEAAAVMGFITAKTEPRARTVLFDTRVIELKHWGNTLGDAMNAYHSVSQALGRGTDCSAPINWAMSHARNLEGVVIYTDSETWAGRNHPMEAISQYRTRTGIATKFINVAFVANAYSVGAADEDAASMECFGFDTGTPAVISEFLRTELAVS